MKYSHEVTKMLRRYAKAEAWECPRCGWVGVMVYNDASSNAWFSWSGAWHGLRPVCPRCGLDEGFNIERPVAD